jgi:hypothetical protein
VTPDDESQVPVEHLAQLLVQHARQDTRLAQRTAANDDAMHSRIQALPAMQREWAPTLQLPPRFGSADSASMEALEELVSTALTSAQDAEALSQEAYDASRRARRGMMVGLALAGLGIAVALASAMGGHLLQAQDNTADLAGQVQALSTLQHHISDQLAELQVRRAVPQISVKPAAQVAAQMSAPASVVTPGQTALPSLSTVPVGVLPAHVAVKTAPANLKPRTADARSASDARSAPDARSASEVAYAWPDAAADPAPPPPPAPIMWHETAPRPRPVRRYQVVMPWPAMYVIGTVRREVRVIFR